MIIGKQTRYQEWWFWKVTCHRKGSTEVCSVPTQSLTLTTTATMSDRDPYDLRAATYTRFRILVIGQANAGKTTLLQRVCDTTEDPCIYDENNKNLVSFHRPQADDEFRFWHFLLAWTYLSDTPLLLVCLTLPIQRGIHDIHIQEQPWIYYLPWFFWIWDRRRKATAGSPVIYGEESRVKRSRQ